MTQSRPTGLELRGVSFRRGQRALLQEVNARFSAGCLTAILGKNGAGKSTLLRLAAGLLTPHAGQVAVTTKSTSLPVLSLSGMARAQLVAYAPDRTDAPFAYKASAVILLGRFPFHRGVPRQADHHRAREELAALGAEGLWNRRLTELSAGELQKVALARVLASDAPIKLFDEPLANLDPGTALELLSRLRARAQAGETIVASLHDLHLAFSAADCALCLKDGVVLSEGALSPQGLSATFAVAVTTGQTKAGDLCLHVARVAGARHCVPSGRT